MKETRHDSEFLAAILREFDCQTGTLHRTQRAEKSLKMICQIGVPDALIDKISLIPFGKGIAGAAAERREPVELCNLQHDLGGVAKIDARTTGVSGSIAIPVISATSGEVLGTLGIGKLTPYEFTEPEKQRLAGIAAEIAEEFEQNDDPQD